jgi:MFS family permease
VLVAALATIVNVGYGTIFYSFGVLLGEGAAAGEFGRALLSASLGAGILVSGLLAPLVGTLCDVAGARRVFLAGAVLGAAGLALFSRAAEGWQVVAVWALLLGPAMACAFYEPAYVTIDQWFGERQGRALGVLTLVAGISATIFIPLTQWLVESFGWRPATLVLGAIQLAVIGALSLFVRDRPREEARAERVSPRAAYGAMLAGLGHTDRTFWLIGAAYFLGLAAMHLMLFHQVAYLQDLGFPAGGVAAAVGAVGIFSLPGRFLVPALSEHVSPRVLISATFGALAASALLLPGASDWWQVYLYVGLFGTFFGAVLPMRAAAMSQHFSGALYGRLMGLQAMMLALATAGGPFLAGLLRDATGSYTVSWLAAAAMFVVAIPAILASGSKGRPETPDV